MAASSSLSISESAARTSGLPFISRVLLLCAVRGTYSTTALAPSHTESTESRKVCGSALAGSEGQRQKSFPSAFVRPGQTGCRAGAPSAAAQLGAARQAKLGGSRRPDSPAQLFPRSGPMHQNAEGELLWSGLCQATREKPSPQPATCFLNTPRAS